jgi:hypothetical protein
VFLVLDDLNWADKSSLLLLRHLVRSDRPAALLVLATYRGCIPFRNIVEIDTMGDEYYAEPHIYCRFADAGAPYEEFRYRLLAEGRYPRLLEAALRVPLEQLLETGA